MESQSLSFFQKVKAQKLGERSSEYDYSNFLTSYASTFITKQLTLVNRVKEINEVDEDGDQVYKVNTTEGIITVSVTDCQCLFRKPMLIPCRHILVLRKKLGIPQFDPQLCDIRWTS